MEVLNMGFTLAVEKSSAITKAKFLSMAKLEELIAAVDRIITEFFFPTLPLLPETAATVSKSSILQEWAAMDPVDRITVWNLIRWLRRFSSIAHILKMSSISSTA